MKAAEVKKLLNTGFAEKLKPLKFKKCSYGYVKDYGNFYIVIIYSSSCYGDLFPTKFACGVGLKTIRGILRRKMPGLMALRENAYPCSFEYRQILLFSEQKYPVQEYKITTEADVKKMVEEVSSFFIETALPYFESIANLEAIAKIRLEEEPDPIGGGDALLYAKLTANPDYESIKAFYRNFIIERKMAPHVSENLEKDIAFLESYTREELLAMAE